MNCLVFSYMVSSHQLVGAGDVTHHTSLCMPLLTPHNIGLSRHTPAHSCGHIHALNALRPDGRDGVCRDGGCEMVYVGMEGVGWCM